MKRSGIIMWFLILCMLGGCSGLSMEELYCLPQAPEDYYDLQEALDAVLSQGQSYQAPATGARREPVQLVDLDGDGVDEAVAFFRSVEDGSVAAYIFARNDSAYELAATIPCSGSAVGNVEYADLDGSGSLELLITCQVSEAVTQALQGIRYRNGQTEVLLTVPCGQYVLTDLNHDGAKEILCLTDSGAEAGAGAVCYTYIDDQLKASEEVRLSGSYSSILKVCQGTLENGVAAATVTSSDDNRRITDVLILSGKEELTTVDCGALGISAQLEDGALYPTDIDGDGALEIPQAAELPAYGKDDGTEWVVSWYGLTSKGASTLKAETYHSFGEGWYLELPEAWQASVTVTEADEAFGACSIHTTGFYRLKSNGKPGAEILTIYALWGASRQERAEQLGLTSLYSDTDMILAVDINEEAAPWDGAISVTQVSERFHVETKENNH